jgi:transcriptional antiterminator RfaH
MNSTEANSTPSWYAIYTNPKQEERADRNLRSWSVETFFPKIKGRGRNQVSGKTFITKPLFPRYVFARFDVNSLLGKVRFTRGVQSVVSLGDGPAPVDEKIIDLIKSNVGQDGFISMSEEFKYGDEVIIQEGPLRNIVGIFQRGIKSSDRVMILLTTISYQSRIIIGRDGVKKIHK